jgi:hypothetical protein
LSSIRLSRVCRPDSEFDGRGEFFAKGLFENEAQAEPSAARAAAWRGLAASAGVDPNQAPSGRFASNFSIALCANVAATTARESFLEVQPKAAIERAPLRFAGRAPDQPGIWQRLGCFPNPA